MANNIYFYSSSITSSIITYDSASVIDNGDSGSTVIFTEISETGSIGVTHFISALELDNSDNLQIRLYSQSLGIDNDLIPLYISSSTPDPLIGINTSNPLTNLDIRAASGSSPASLILRTNEDGVIQVGEETGRIIFAIESSSYLGTGFISSGSTAAIYSRVINSNAAGAYGSLIFEVNDSNDVTTPVEALNIGYGADPTFNGVGVAMSASMVMTSANPVLRIKNDNTNYQIARLGWHSPTDQNDGQLLLFNQGNESVKLNGDASPADASFIRYGNLALGITTAPERLTVEGNISASGNIIGNINGGSF